MSTQLKSEADRAFVSLQHIHKTFLPDSVSEVVLFTDFSLTVEKGRFVSIIGSNGSGKTTILNLICGSIPADSGSIGINGRVVDKMKEYERSRFIGRVFQDPSKGTCPQLTILENMALADNKGGGFGLERGVSKKRLDTYRTQLELLRLGLEDKLGLQVGSLSGGQRQALALLICTMTPLDLLILDEHTAALDPRSSENVMELTERIVREKKLTTLMVTHNLKFAAQYGDRLIMMHRGSVVVDAAGAAKSALHIRDLTDKFNEISIEDGN
ncbi:MAG: ATP-binding cassette domain-containing protein [Clostridiales bacterium]|jgi:putative ABC transport system ATP-binding protein|nr:ATP-binding cassette domain-containing protein [Clostridiales bacterium]